MVLEDKIQTLIKILEGSSIDELEVSTFWGNQKIRLRKNNMDNKNNIDVAVSEQPPQTGQDTITNTIEKEIIEVETIIEPQSFTKPESLIVEEEQPSENIFEITAPLVGTFYRSTKPDSPPFLNVGDMVEIGQIVCIIEAMKIFNEIESEIAGIVEKILISDGTPVEYGQALITVKPV